MRRLWRGIVNFFVEALTEDPRRLRTQARGCVARAALERLFEGRALI